MAEKLEMKSMDMTQENIRKIQTLFPNVVTEVIKDGKTQLAVDFDALKEELSIVIAEGKQERYQMTWPEKSKAKLLAAQQITATLRPCKEESVDFDTTKNLYIEGDNLDVLKLLQETYLGKVKMIYIDPPYNTGNDFVYEDDFAQGAGEYAEISGDYDEQGNRLFKNTDSNGRFHTDWLNMIYPRLKVAKDFLSDDGVIFISIDENEVHNMRKICDEIFGESNFISQLGWQKVYSPKNQARYFSNDYEFILCYCRSIAHFKVGMLPRTQEMNARYKNPDNDPRGDWKPGDCVGSGERKNGYYDVVSPTTGRVFNVPKGKHWVYAPETMKVMLEENRIYFGKDGNAFPAVKQFLSDVNGRRPSSLLMYEDYGHTDMAKKDIIKLFHDLEQVPFDTPKPVKLIKMLAIIGSGDNDIIMDFFSGSATTAQAIMELNAEQKGSRRKFILVQLPELLENNPGASRINLNTIADVGKERIRRAGSKIIAEKKTYQDDFFGAITDDIQEKGLFEATAGLKANIGSNGLDIGFRVLKLDSSNMQNVYYNPNAMSQDLLELTIDNIKPDRTPMDLLFQVMLSLGVELSAKIEEKEVAGKKYYIVNNGALIACFDDNINNEAITEIAKLHPIYAVFRDKSFANDSVGINNEQLFKTYSHSTIVKVL